MDTNSGGASGAQTPQKSRIIKSEKGKPSNGAEDASEAINVVVRCRGRNSRETEMKSPIVVDVPSTTGSNQVSINTSSDFSLASKLSSTRTYTVDQVYGPGADQSLFFKGVASSLFNEFMNGYNCTIFAYGQTGTGKTYTMCGDLNSQYKQTSETISANAGLIPRILCKLFENVGYNNNNLNNRKENDDDDIVVKCSFVEIYNEELKDLLSNSKVPTKLRIFEQKKSHYNTNDNSAASIKIDGLEEFYIKNEQEGLVLLQKGMEARKTAATKMNDLSSRSHTIFTITLLRKKDKTNGNEYQLAKMNLVDLAGSENINRSGAVHQRAKEAGSINQSLLTLGRVINALVDGGAYIPYRESKLTRLLQDSLGGNTKTVLVANVSPSSVDCQATISTLEYAAKAKNIKNIAQIGHSVLKNVLLKDFADEISRLKLDLNATRSKDGFFMNEANFNELMIEHENFKSEIEELKRSKETMARQLSYANAKAEQSSSILLENNTRIKELETDNAELDDKLEALKAHDLDLFQKTQKLLMSVNSDMKSTMNLQSKNDKFLKEKIETSLSPLFNEISQLVNNRDKDSAQMTNSLMEITSKIANVLSNTLNKTLKDMSDKSAQSSNEIEKFEKELSSSFEKFTKMLNSNNEQIKKSNESNMKFDSFITNNLFSNSNNMVQSYVKANAHKIDEISEAFKEKLAKLFNDSLIDSSNYLIKNTKLSLSREQQIWNNDFNSINSSLIANNNNLLDELANQDKSMLAHLTHHKEDLKANEEKIQQLSNDIRLFKNDTNDMNNSVSLIKSTMDELESTRDKLFKQLEKVNMEISKFNSETNSMIKVNSQTNSNSQNIHRELNQFTTVIDSKIKNYTSLNPAQLTQHQIAYQQHLQQQQQQQTNNINNNNNSSQQTRPSTRGLSLSRSTSSSNEDLYIRLSRSPTKTPNKTRRAIPLNNTNASSLNFSLSSNYFNNHSDPQVNIRDKDKENQFRKRKMDDTDTNGTGSISTKQHHIRRGGASSSLSSFKN